MINLAKRMAKSLGRIARETRGSMAIETALVAPVLVMLSVGSFEVSRMVSRQQELQNGVEEAQAIALAANMGAETNTQQLATILKDSLGLYTSQVTVTKLYRCNNQSTLTATATACSGSSDVLSSYVKIQLRDSFQPIWSKIGVKRGFNYNVTRMVQLT